MRWPPRELSEHEFRLAQIGKTPGDLARFAGMSEAGVRRLLRANELPVNPQTRKRYLRLLQLPIAPTAPTPATAEPPCAPEV